MVLGILSEHLIREQKSGIISGGTAGCKCKSWNTGAVGLLWTVVLNSKLAAKQTVKVYYSSQIWKRQWPWLLLRMQLHADEKDIASWSCI